VYYILVTLDQISSLDILNSFITTLTIEENKLDLYYKRLNHLNKDYK